MSARSIVFSGEFSAPTHATLSAPFAQVGPVIAGLGRRLLARQRGDGSWRERPPGDAATIADVLALFAFLGRDDPRRRALLLTLFDQQLPDGGWPRSPYGPSDLDVTARAYLALMLHTPGSPLVLQRARERLAAWGSGQCAPRTRLHLALFGQLPHAEDRSALTADSALEQCALQVIHAKRPVRETPKDPVLAHLFRDNFRPALALIWNPLRVWDARRAGQQLANLLTTADPADVAGPTSILPLVALHCLGHDDHDVAVRAAWRMLDERIIDDDVAPALSPLKDTALALAALREAGTPADAAPVVAASEWLWARLVAGQARGDLAVADAAAVLIALAKSGFAFRGDRPALVDHVLHSLFDEQDDEGGWDSAELTGLVLEALGQFGIPATEPVVADAIGYLEARPADANCHTGRRVLAGLRAVQRDMNSPIVRRAAESLRRAQHAGGGWGDSGATACALIALMAAGDANSPEVDAGVDWLLSSTGESFEEMVDALVALGQFERHAAGWNS